MPIESRNPATGEIVRTYAEMEPAAVAAILGEAQRQFEQWRRVSAPERARSMARAADVLDARRDAYARLMVEEMGKPIRQARAEVEKCAWCCRYYAEEGPGLVAPKEVATDATRSFVAFEPIGVVLAVMPWNFPFWQVFRFAAPALVAGNAAVLKHASNVPACALAIEEVFAEAGFPAGLFRALLIGSGRVDAVLEDERVRAATLTGSTPAGRSIGAKAGALSEEDRARAGRQRSLSRPRRRRSRPGGGGLRLQPARQRRAELHRSEAVHRRSTSGPTVRGALHRAHGRDQDGRSDRRGDRARSARPPRPARRAASTSGQERRSGRGCSSAAKCRADPAPTTRRPCSLE